VLVVKVVALRETRSWCCDNVEGKKKNEEAKKQRNGLIGRRDYCSKAGFEYLAGKVNEGFFFISNIVFLLSLL
jgi:hypothetical protein